MLTTTAPRFVAIGDVIADKYRVDHILGIGGMGMVVAATHLLLGQEVAIKLMLPTTNANAATRFLREAQAVVRLRSEHICRVLDVGTFRDTPYMVMEMLHGRDLSQELAHRQRIPLVELVDTLMQTLEALAEAHAVGIVHRDLKPANLFVTKTNDGSPLIKLLDFGISKLSGGSTRTSEMMGTPSYMAPEQIASAKNVDQRADIWAVGVIAYEATCGHAPFLGETLPATVMAVIQSEPAPLTNVPIGFAHAVARCLAKHPDHRFTNVADLALAIAPFGSPASELLAHKIGKLMRPSARHLEVAPKIELAWQPAPTTLGSAAAVVSTSAPHVSNRRLGGIAFVVMLGAGLGVGAATKLFAKGASAAPANEPAIAMVAPAKPPPPVAAAPVTVAPAAVAPVAVAVQPAAIAEPVKSKLAHHRVEVTVAPAPSPATVVVAPAPAPVPIAAAAIVAAPVVADNRALMPLPTEPTAPLHLEPAMIADALDRARNNIVQICGVAQELHGNVTFHVKVAPDGVVDSITAAPASQLGKCVIDRLQRVQFAITQRGGSFEKTYVF